MLNDVKTCIESSKYTGAYQSEVCKEILSRYVCQTASDLIVSAGSGCGPMGWRNFFEKNASNPSVLDYFGATTSGVTDGLGGALTDFGRDYGNAKVDEMIGGGVGGVAQKACMAALGYDWELDFNNLMDMAYSSEFASNVMAPTLRRNFLFINPATGRPVFEYRGGIYITPGCDIDGFSAQLVCVSRLEKTKYPKSVKCISDQTCACLNAPSAQYYQLPVTSAGKLTQSVPFEKSFHVVGENEAKVYDHLKVELIFSDPVKKKNCLPSGYEDGVFYMPIGDMTPLNLIGCDVRATGDVVCTSGIAKELGFGNLQIRSIEMSDTFSVGSTAIVKPIITKSGTEKMCLWYRVYKGKPEAGAVVFENHQVEINELYSDQKLEPGLNIFGTTVPENLLGGGSTTATPAYNVYMKPSVLDDQKKICQNYQLGAPAPSYLVVQDSISGNIKFYVRDGDNKDGKFECKEGSTDSYSFDGSTFTPLTPTNVPNCIIQDKGVKINFGTYTLPGSCNSANVDKVEINFVVTNPNQGSSGGDAQMTLVLEGRIPSKTGSCGDGAVKIPNAVYTQPFRVVRATTLTTECQDLSGNKGTCQTSGSSGCYQGICPASQCCVPKTTQTSGPTSPYEPISIIDEATRNPINPQGPIFTLIPDKEYSLAITKPTDTSNLLSVVYKIEDMNSNVIKSADLSYDAITSDNSKYYYLTTITTSLPLFNKSETYAVYAEIHTKDNKIIPLPAKYMYIQPTLQPTQVGIKCGPADIGPTSKKGNSGYCLSECSEDKDISEFITHEDYQCKESGKKCCMS